MLVGLPDNEILLIFREARWRGRFSHKDPTTRMSLLRSRDGGRTWFSQVTADPSGGNGCAITRLSDGTLFANAYHWEFAPPDREDRFARWPRHGTMDWLDVAWGGAGVFTTRSETDGYTWKPVEAIQEPLDWPDIASHSHPVELDNSELILPVTGRRSPDDRAHGLVLRSSDTGHTWDDPVCITDDAPDDQSFHETRIVKLPDGKLLAMHRTPEGNYWRNYSDDGGHTWSASRETSIWCGGSSPPDLRLLSDGRLLLSRGYRREPFGVRAYVSEDEGRTWSDPIILRQDGVNWDMGYPSTLELNDGRLLTVYYWHQDGPRYLARTIWSLDG